MNNIPPNPCTECCKTYSEDCHINCEDILSYAKYRRCISSLVKKGFSLENAVKIVNAQHSRR